MPRRARLVLAGLTLVSFLLLLDDTSVDRQRDRVGVDDPLEPRLSKKTRRVGVFVVYIGNGLCRRSPTVALDRTGSGSGARTATGAEIVVVAIENNLFDRRAWG